MCAAFDHERERDLFAVDVPNLDLLHGLDTDHENELVELPSFVHDCEQRNLLSRGPDRDTDIPGIACAAP